MSVRLRAGLLVLLLPGVFFAAFFLASCQGLPALISSRPAETPTVPPGTDGPGDAGADVPTQVAPASMTFTLEPSATPFSTPAPTPTPTVPPLKQTENILVMSVDHRKDDPDPTWRTDSIIIVAIDAAAGRVGLVNIPRDLWVDIPGLGEGRINQADYYGEITEYPGGGPALIGNVLSDTLGIPTLHYVRVQFDGLTRLVDALGGITVTLDCPLYERGSKASAPNGVEEFYLPAGQVWLDGATAKKFATWRYVESDFGRTRRQQQVIWAIRQRALQVDAIPRIPAMWQALSDVFTTDLGLLDVIKLARLGVTLQAKDVHSTVLSLNALDYSWTNEGASVLVVKDREELERELNNLWGGVSVATLGSAKKTADCPPPPTAIPTYTPTTTPTGTIMVTETPTDMPTSTSTPTATGTITPTATVTFTGTVTATGTLQTAPSAPATPTPTGTPEATPGA